jgi:Mn-dependent DtxR family transcriptional regulator
VEGTETLLRARRQWRRQLLRALYDRAAGSVSEFVPAFDLAADLGIEASEAARIVAYLAEKGWVFVDSHRDGIVRITAAGVDEVESSA